jgi:hypothetical protein
MTALSALCWASGRIPLRVFAFTSMTAKSGMTAETLRTWVR